MVRYGAWEILLNGKVPTINFVIKHHESSYAEGVSNMGADMLTLLTYPFCIAAKAVDIRHKHFCNVQSAQPLPSDAKSAGLPRVEGSLALWDDWKSQHHGRPSAVCWICELRGCKPVLKIIRQKDNSSISPRTMITYCVTLTRKSHGFGSAEDG